MKIFGLLLILGFHHQGMAKSEAAPPACPQGVGAQAGDSPVFVAPAGGTTLFLCGWRPETAAKRDTENIFSEFDVYVLDPKGSSSKSLFQAGALDTYRVSKTKEGLKLEEMTLLREKLQPFFETMVICKNGTCEVSPSRCVHKRGGKAPGKAFARMKPYLEGRQQGRTPDEALVEEVGSEAMEGNKKAQGFFLISTSREKLRLDGASAEVWEVVRKNLQRMKQARCL